MKTEIPCLGVGFGVKSSLVILHISLLHLQFSKTTTILQSKLNIFKPLAVEFADDMKHVDGCYISDNDDEDSCAIDQEGMDTDRYHLYDNAVVNNDLF